MKVKQPPVVPFCRDNFFDNYNEGWGKESFFSGSFGIIRDKFPIVEE